MPPKVRRQCGQCGTLHMRSIDVCWQCERSNYASANARYCVICDSKIPNHPGRGSSSYCSLVCATLVSRSREKAARAVAKKIRLGEIPKAREFCCVDCGKPALDYEHRDYGKPLEIVPVCRSCNLKRGPALNIKDFVADHLGIHVSCLAQEAGRLKERARLMYLRLLRPDVFEQKTDQKAT